MKWLINNVYWNDGITEAVIRRCSATSLKKRLYEFFIFFKNTYFYRTPPVAAPRWNYTLFCKQRQAKQKKKENLTPLG